MKLAFVTLALVTLIGCAPVVDTRDAPTIAATATARALLPLPPIPGGVIRFVVRVTPTPLPDWEYVVTPEANP